MSVLKQRYAGMKILVGRDKLDEIQVRFVVQELKFVIHDQSQGCAPKNLGIRSILG